MHNVCDFLLTRAHVYDFELHEERALFPITRVARPSCVTMRWALRAARASHSTPVVWYEFVFNLFAHARSCKQQPPILHCMMQEQTSSTSHVWPNEGSFNFQSYGPTKLRPAARLWCTNRSCTFNVYAVWAHGTGRSSLTLQLVKSDDLFRRRLRERIFRLVRVRPTHRIRSSLWARQVAPITRFGRHL